MPLGFRIGEDVAPNGELYVHQSAVSRIEGLEPEARRDPSTRGRQGRAHALRREARSSG